MKCIPQVLNIDAKAKIMFRLTLSTTYEKRSVDIHIGDFIKGLIYQDGDNLKEVSGVVKSINTFERTLPRSAYNSPEYMSMKNIIESITLDISEKYSSELFTVDIVDIRNYDMVIHNTLDIRHFKIIDDTTIEFYSETKPIAFVWNDETFPIEYPDEEDFIYRVKIDTVCMTNLVTIFDDSGSIYRRIINGPDIDIVDENEVKSTISITMENLKKLYFEKYNAIDLTEMVADMIYVPILENIGDVEDFAVNDETYFINNLPSVSVEIPNRDAEVNTLNTLTCYPFKVIDNNLCVCAPIIGHYTDLNGNITIEIKGYKQSWNILDIKYNNIDIDDILVLDNPGSYKYTVKKSSDTFGRPVINFTRTHKSAYVNYLYNKIGNSLENGIMCIAISNDNGWSYTYRLVSLDTLKNRQNDESIYISNKYLENAPVVFNGEVNFDYKINFFNIGYFEFSMNMIDEKA